MIMQNIQLKRATSNDWHAIAEIETRVDHKLFFSFECEAEIVNYIKKSVVYLITNDSETVGTISYTIKPDKTVYFDSLVVLPQYRHLDIATAAMNNVMQEIGTKNCSFAVHPENSGAIKLYLNFGFVITAWKDNFLTMASQD